MSLQGLLLFLSYLPALYFYCAWGAFVDFRLTTEDPNHLTLECYSEVTGDVDDGATIDFFDTPSEGAAPHGNVVDTFDVTPENESFFRCTSSEGRRVKSDFVAIAAVPPDFSMEPPRTMNVFNDANAELECVIMLGRLFNHLVPYVFSWQQFDSRGFAVPVDSPLYSNNNRVLTISIDNTTRSNQYRCVLQLSRCDSTRTGGVPRCPEMTHEGPWIQFEVFEPSRIIARPDLQQISANDVASFVCVGFGSFISISWEYGDVCGAESCNGAVVPNETVRGNVTNRRIEATLMINASMLQFPPNSAVVRCILHQIVPSNLSLQGESDKPFSAKLMVTDIPDLEGTPSTSTENASTTTAQVTTSSTGTVAGPTNRIWIIAVTVIIALIFAIVVVVILVLVARQIFRKKKGKGIYSFQTCDLPDVGSTNSQHKPNHRDYEELDVRYISGTENRCLPFQRQNGIEFDPSNPKADNFSNHGSDDHCSKSGGGGSDLSGLSGVSGNIPGAHRMPTYSHDPSVVSASERFLVPPQTCADRRCSDSSRRTQSTIVPSVYPPEPFNPRSATEVCHSCQNQIPIRFGSHERVNIRESAFVMREQHYPQQQYVNPPSFCGHLPPHACASHMSHTSSASKGSDSMHSGSSQHFISDATLLTVLNCLMHNEDCQIWACPCRQLRDRYGHLEASRVPLQQKKSPERRHKKHRPPTSSSTESDSDVPGSDPSSKKANMHLKLHDEKKLHPHYHISTGSHRVGRGSNTVENRRRSRSLSDLTPITELRETPTPCPLMGGAIKAGTPVHCDKTLGDGGSNEEADLFQQTKDELLHPTALLTPLLKPSPLLLREISLSSDNLPVLCLNSCPLQLKTPSPLKGKGRDLGKRNLSKPPLEPLRENSNSTETDDSNTSSRSNSTAENETAKSDNDEGIEVSLVSQNTPLDCSSFRPVRRGESSGYESEPITTVSGTTSSLHGQGVIKDYVSPRSCSPFDTKATVGVANSNLSRPASINNVSPRSCSPFETISTVSYDGAIIETTEC